MAIKISNETIIDDNRNLLASNTAIFTANTSIKLPSGNTAQRSDSPENGMIRYNEDDSVFESYVGGGWITLGNEAVLIATPVNVSPADLEANVGRNPVLEATTFRHAYNDVDKANGIWQVSVLSDFSNTVVDATVSGNANTFTLVTDLDVSTTYYWKVKYEDELGNESSFSTPTEFSTASSFPPTVLGESFGGGFYTGAISIDGGTTCYYLVLSPNAEGCGSARTFRTPVAGTGSTSGVNGHYNTYFFQNNVFHPAGQFAATRTINGFSDWYLPASGELSQMATNCLCMPAGERYVNVNYWSSSESPSNDQRATAIKMDNNDPTSTYKNETWRVRAIRRVLF